MSAAAGAGRLWLRSGGRIALGYHAPIHSHRERRPCALIAGVAMLAALAMVPMAMAQEAHDHGLGRLGRVSFPVSCTPEAQRRFEHAVAVLHSFWWEEGERVFGAVLETDSQLAGDRRAVSEG